MRVEEGYPNKYNKVLVKTKRAICIENFIPLFIVFSAQIMFSQFDVVFFHAASERRWNFNTFKNSGPALRSFTVYPAQPLVLIRLKMSFSSFSRTISR